MIPFKMKTNKLLYIRSIQLTNFYDFGVLVVLIYAMYWFGEKVYKKVVRLMVIALCSFEKTARWLAAKFNTSL